MKVRFHPHALQRMTERGATKEEVIDTVQNEEQFTAKHDRGGFRRNFLFQGMWRGRHFASKQVEVFAVAEEEDWLVISVLVKYF